MRTTKSFFLILISLALIVSTSCNKDSEEDGPEVSPFIGDYLITEAVLAEALVLTTIEAGPIQVPVDTDITQMIQQALLGAIECTPENSLIELREDYSIYLSCAGSDTELDAGTWEEVSETEMKLNMNSSAIPSAPAGVVLTVSNIVIDGDVLSGETTVPLSSEMLAGVVATMSGGLAHLDMEKTPAAVPVTFTIELTKQ